MTHHKKRRQPSVQKKRAKKRKIWKRVVFWSLVSGGTTIVLSWFTRGYWEPEKNIHFVEFATLVMTAAEEVEL